MIPEEKRTFCTMHINLPASPNVVLWIIKSPLSSIVRRRLMACLEPVNEQKSTENLRFILIQTNRIFHFSRRLFAKHHTLSSWSRIFSSRSRHSLIIISHNSHHLHIFTISSHTGTSYSFHQFFIIIIIF